MLDGVGHVEDDEPPISSPDSTLSGSSGAGGMAYLDVGEGFFDDGWLRLWHDHENVAHGHMHV